MRKLSIIALLLLALPGCGRRTDLSPKQGMAIPPRAATAAVTPTPAELMTPDTQARPKRSDEQLRRSEERRQDKFDLPPS